MSILIPTVIDLWVKDEIATYLSVGDVQIIFHCLQEIFRKIYVVISVYRLVGKMMKILCTDVFSTCQTQGMKLDTCTCH